MNTVMFRKPVKYPNYFVLLVKTHGIWCIDSGSWNELEIKALERMEKAITPKQNIKIITSPSDDDRVILQIVAQLNRH